MTTPTLNEWISALRPFEGAEPQLKALSESDALYLIEWAGSKAVLKLFRDEGATTPGERAIDKAASEAEGLRRYSPRGLAPQLIWEGSLSDNMGGYAVIYKWVDGASLCDAPSDADIDLYADALWAIHSEQTELKMLSPNPRNLETWWLRTHEKYRDSQADIQQSLPESVSNELGRLIQSVAADAQAHKRFWQGATLVPVQGNPTCDNVIMQGEQAVFINWQRFGLGDPAYEVTLAASQYFDKAQAKRILAHYVERANEPMLNTRIQLYCRLWPFGRVIALLAGINLRSESWGVDLLRNLKACIETYSRPKSDPMSIYGDAEGWVSSQYLHYATRTE